MVILASKGAEMLLMGPALEKPESAINRISNVEREGWVGTLALAGYGVARGTDASSRFPQRPEQRGGGRDRETGTDTISHKFYTSAVRKGNMQPAPQV